MKKAIAIFLVIITLFSLSACGKKDKASEAKEEEKYTFYTFADNILDGRFCESYDYAEKDFETNAITYEDKTVKQQLTLEILGQTLELNYEESFRKSGFHNQHNYVVKNNSKYRVNILDNHIIKSFKIPYTTAAQTEEEVYSLVKELLPLVDLSLNEHSFEVNTNRDGSYSGFDYDLINPATRIISYSISYSSEYNTLSFYDFISFYVNHEKEDEMIADLEMLKAEAEKFLISRGSSEEKDNVLDVKFTGAKTFIADENPYMRISFQIMVARDDADMPHTYTEDVLIKYNG